MNGQRKRRTGPVTVGGFRAACCVTHSPDSPLFEMFPGPGGPTQHRPRGSPPAPPVRSRSSPFMNNAGWYEASSVQGHGDRAARPGEKRRERAIVRPGPHASPLRYQKSSAAEADGATARSSTRRWPHLVMHNYDTTREMGRSDGGARWPLSSIAHSGRTGFGRSLASCTTTPIGSVTTRGGSVLGGCVRSGGGPSASTKACPKSAGGRSSMRFTNVRKPRSSPASSPAAKPSCLPADGIPAPRPSAAGA